MLSLTPNEQCQSTEGSALLSSGYYTLLRHCLLRAHGQPTATGVLPSLDKSCGTSIKWRHGGDFQKTAEDISV